MLKSDVEKDIEEGGQVLNLQHGDKRGTYKTGHKKSYMKPGVVRDQEVQKMVVKLTKKQMITIQKWEKQI